jgi:hypothetical protein
VFTIEYAEGEETLPGFSFEDEAFLFLRLEELICVLLRVRAGAGRMALDPLPGVPGRETACLVSLG